MFVSPTTETQQEGNSLLSSKVYPNPATSKLSIEYYLQEEGVTSIYNSLGINVFSMELISNSSIQVLDIEDLPSGTYILNIKGAQYTKETLFFVTIKLLKFRYYTVYFH